MPLTFVGVDLDRYWRQGEAQKLSVVCTDPLTGNLIDLTAAQARYKLNTPTPIIKDSTLAGQITVDATSSTITVNLSGTDTINVTPGIYDHELIVLLNTGEVRTVMQGLVQFVTAVAQQYGT